MPILENGCYVPETGFQPTPGYKDFSKTPSMVLPETASILELYFGSALGDLNRARSFLAEDALWYIDQAENGFHVRFDKTRQLGGEELDVAVLASQGRLRDPDIEANEAFGHAVTIFGWMTQFRAQWPVEYTFSNRQTLRPPGTTMEHLTRIWELRRELHKIVHGETEPDVVVEKSPPLLRTYAFFWAGRALVEIYGNKQRVVEAVKSLQ